jgi:hypothetical protein
MRSRFAILLALPLLVGCPDKKTDPPSAGTASSATTPPSASTASSGTTSPSAETPTTPVAGLIKGKPFTPDEVVFQGNSLTFRRGKEFFPEMEIRVVLPIKDSGSLKETEWKHDGNQSGNPVISVSGKEVQDAKGIAESPFVQPGDFTMTLKVSKKTPRSVEGVIDLKVSKPANTHLAGQFKATIKKTAFEPLDAEDAPYIQGKITIVGPWKTEQIGAGFVGKTTDGKTPSNFIGSKMTAGESTWMTNGSFEPQVTGLTNDAKSGPMYRHTRMLPGEYWVFARRGGVVAAWKKVTVNPGDQLTVDLTIDPAKTGELVITIPEEEAKEEFEYHLSLIPDEIKDPGQGGHYSFNAAEVKKGQTTVTVKGVPAGKYKAIRGKSESDVEVVAGKSTAVTLVRKTDPKK